MLSRLSLTATVIALVAGGTATARTPPGPVTAREWRAVLADWLAHGRFVESHPCADAVVARTHAPPRYKEGSALVHALDLYELQVCRHPGNASGVRLGMTDREVAEVAGVPVPWRSGPHAWSYRTPGDGRRIVFSPAGYVVHVQIAMHG